MSEKKIKAVRGMHDITPDRSGHWARIEAVLADVLGRYAYREIRMPLVESTRLFKRSIGEVTDIVEKEMYTFADRNEESLSLRPEGTAGCVRACIENALLDTPQRLWYMGPMFRYERPQKGRQRQFHQIGAEAFGFAGVEIELETLLLNRRFWTELGLGDSVRLQLNNIGSAQDRQNYRQALIDYLNRHRDSLDEDSQRRLESNPLRILDSKSPQTQALLDDAPSLEAYLSEASRQRMDELAAGLEAAGLVYELNERLVRGLDYYNDTVFEWVSDDLGAQATVCAGGRYDGLVEQLGGRPTPAFGFAMGMERLYLLLEAKQFAALAGSDAPDIYLVVEPGQQPAAFRLVEELRSAMPQSVIMHGLVAGSMKNQFKKADKSGARFALVLGESEVASQQLSVKDLKRGEQQTVSIEGSLQALVDVLQTCPEEP